MDIRNIVILTGAGVSAESGLATFRGPDGLWEGHRVEDVAHARGLSRAIRRWSTLSTTRGGRSSARSSPMPRIEALARLDAEWPGELLLVTQNVDDLHERAGSKRLLHMHGELTKRLVPRLRRALRVGRADGRGRGLSGMRRERAGAARHRLVRRDALRDGADRRGAARAATCSCRSARRARSIPPPASSRPRAIAARGRWR